MTLKEATKILGEAVKDTGGLWQGGYGLLQWEPQETEVTMDGVFTADELEAIAVWMRAKRVPRA